MAGHELRGDTATYVGRIGRGKSTAKEAEMWRELLREYTRRVGGRQAARPNRGDRREKYKRAVMAAVMKAECQLCEAVTTILKRGNRLVSHMYINSSRRGRANQAHTAKQTVKTSTTEQAKQRLVAVVGTSTRRAVNRSGPQQQSTRTRRGDHEQRARAGQSRARRTDSSNRRVYMRPVPGAGGAARFAVEASGRGPLGFAII